jgi:hypothetical protein
MVWRVARKEITHASTLRQFVYILRLPLSAALVIAAMTSLPADSYAGKCVRFWEYDYYYDAAHTQWAGYCTGSCEPGGAWCMGDITEYYFKYGGGYCGPGCGLL